MVYGVVNNSSAMTIFNIDKTCNFHGYIDLIYCGFTRSMSFFRDAIDTIPKNNILFETIFV